MLVKTHVDARAKLMRAFQPTDVVEELWGGYCTKRAWRVDEGYARIVKREGRNIREIWIRLPLGEQEDETGEPEDELVVDVCCDLRTEADRQILGRAEHFAERREAREDLWPAVERIPLLRILIRIEETAKNRIPLIEGVIDTSGVMRSLVFRRRIPGIGGRIQSVADRIIVRLRVGAE